MENKKLNIFISQPMFDKTSDDIYDTMKRVKEKVINYFKEDVKILPSYFDKVPTGDLNVKNEPLYCLSKSLEILSCADVIVMTTGWENCRGCKIEYECARLYGIMVIYEDTNYITRKKLFEVDNDTAPGN